MRIEKKIKIEQERIRHRASLKGIKEGKSDKKSSRKSCKKSKYEGLIKAIRNNPLMKPATKKKAIDTLRRRLK